MYVATLNNFSICTGNPKRRYKIKIYTYSIIANLDTIMHLISRYCALNKHRENRFNPFICTIHQINTNTMWEFKPWIKWTSQFQWEITGSWDNLSRLIVLSPVAKRGIFPDDYYIIIIAHFLIYTYKQKRHNEEVPVCHIAWEKLLKKAAFVFGRSWLFKLQASRKKRCVFSPRTCDFTVWESGVRSRDGCTLEN